MAKQYSMIYFNKDTEQEKSFSFDSFNENVTNNNLNLNVHYDLGTDDEIPDFGEMNALTFENMVIVDKGGNEVPHFGNYSKINDISVNYYSTDNIYRVNVNLA